MSSLFLSYHAIIICGEFGFPYWVRAQYLCHAGAGRGPPVCSDSVSVISSSMQPVWSGEGSPGHWNRSGTPKQPWGCINRLRWWSRVSLTSIEWRTFGSERGPCWLMWILTDKCQVSVPMRPKKLWVWFSVNTHADQIECFLQKC